MPIDPSIALGVKAPQIENPFDQFSRLRQLQVQGENIASLAAERQANAALAQQRLAENQRTLQGRSALISAIRDAQTTDPDTGEPSTDHRKVVSALATAGFPEQAEAWSKTTTANQEMLDKLATSQKARRQATVDTIGSLAETIKSRHDFDAALGVLASPQYGAITGQQALQLAKQADELGPDGWQTIVNQYKQLTTAAQKRRETVETELAKPTKLSQGEVVVIPETGQIMARGLEKPKEGPTIGSFEDYVARAAAQEGRDIKTLSTKDIDRYRETYRLDPRITIKTPREVTPTAALNMTRSLRNDFTKETGAARTIEAQLANMKSSLDAVRKGGAPAGSQGVLVTFQKILDPTSVVRESEYARSASGLSLLGRLEGQWMRMQQGGAGVTVKDLEQFVNLAEQFAQNQRRAAAETKGQIDAIADEYGLKKELITREIGGLPNPPPPPGGTVITVTAPNGKTYTFKSAAEAAAFKKRAGIP